MKTILTIIGIASLIVAATLIANKQSTTTIESDIFEGLEQTGVMRFRVGSECQSGLCPRTWDWDNKGFTCPNDKYEAKLYHNTSSLEFRDYEPFGWGETWHIIRGWNNTQYNNQTYKYASLRDNNYMMGWACQKNVYNEFDYICNQTRYTNKTRFVGFKVVNGTQAPGCAFSLDLIQ